MTTSNVQKSERQWLVDHMRAFAALWVVLFHLSEGRHIEQLKEVLNKQVVHAVFENGYLGVAIFFVLSGYVMAMVTKEKVFDILQASIFLAKRLVRLSPPYYVAILLSVLVVLIKAQSGTSPTFSAMQIVTHLFYAQSLFSFPHLNIIFWTLCVEVQFYAFFALILLLSSSHSTKVRLITVTGIASLLWPLGIIKVTLWNDSFLPFWYAFSTGALTFYAIDTSKVAQRPPLLAIGTCLIAVMFITGSEFPIAVGCTAVLLYLPTTFPTNPKFNGLPYFGFIGAVSYSLYLLHNNVTGGVSRLLHRFLPSGATTDLMIGVCILAACIFASWLNYRFVERPSIHLAAKLDAKLRSFLDQGKARWL
jgi:peptidoglycan/LPS O-acetylase OafA/YrhL